MVHCPDQGRSGLGGAGRPGGRGAAGGRARARAAAGGPDPGQPGGPDPGQQGPSSEGAAAWLGGPLGDQGAFRVRPHSLSAAAARRDKAGNWQRWYRQNIPIAEQLYLEYTTEQEE